MKLLLDMNISPLCVASLQQAGHDALHWSVVGNPAATDAEIMSWAYGHGMVVLTHDLDFGDMLGAAGSNGPSVIQIRAERLAVPAMTDLVCAALRACTADLEQGALLTLDAKRCRVRLLPIRRAQDRSDS